MGGYPRGNTFGAVIGSRSAKGREDYRKYHASAIDVPGQSSLDLPDGYSAQESHVQDYENNCLVRLVCICRSGSGQDSISSGQVQDIGGNGGD